MAKSTQQTKPNLFGTLTQKPVSSEKSSYKQSKKTVSNIPDPSNNIITSNEKVDKKATSVESEGEASKITGIKPISSSPFVEATEKKEIESTAVEKTLPSDKEIPFSNREGTNHASLLLTKTNLKFLRIRTRQLGTTLQKYVDLLLKEEKERWNDEPGYADTIYDYCENRFKEEKKVMSLITSKEGNDFLNEGSIEAGIKKVTFMNYIISREIEREASGQKRISM